MNGSTARYVIDLVGLHRRLLARFIATSVARSALVMGSVLLIRDFLFAVLNKQALPAAPGTTSLNGGVAVWGIGVLLIVSYVASSLLYYHNEILRQRIVKMMELTLMERVVRHLLSLSVRFFDRASHGDLVHAIRQDVIDIRTIVMSCATVLMQATVALGLLGAAVWISPRLAFWALLVLPLAACPLVIIARRTRVRSFAERRSAYAVFDVLLQMLQGIRIIKAYQGEQQEARTIVEKAQSLLDEQIRIVQTRELSNVLLESLAGFSIATVIIIGGFQVMEGAMQWPQLLAFLVAVRSLHGPMEDININAMEIQRHAAATDRIEQLLAERPEMRNAPDAVPLGSPPERIAFDNVSFSYDQRPALETLSFEVRAGETLGIAGPSGSGKTTLLSLVARFYDPTSGVVRVDGRDLREFRIEDVYGQIGIVTQQPFLFATSVRANIRCGRPDAADADVEAAARIAEIHEEILALPRGYDTSVGVAGRILSGGQAQRINVARAIIKNAPILLLDEATSSLDSIAETKVQRAIDRLMEGRTSFIVAHRLSSLRNADRILVLDHGKAVGLGTHQTLLRDCPLYRQMWETQLLGDSAQGPAATDPLDRGDQSGLADEDLVL